MAIAFTFYQQLKLQQATAQNIIDDAIVFLYSVAKNEKTLAGKLPGEYSAFILKLRNLYQDHRAYHEFYQAVLPIFQTGNIVKLSGFLKSLLNDHHHILTTNDYTADEAVCLLNQCIVFRKASSIESNHYSPPIDSLLAYLAALPKQDLSANDELNNFNLGDVQKLKEDTLQLKKHATQLISDLEFKLVVTAGMGIHEMLLTLPLAVDYTQPLSSQLPADSTIGQVIDKFPHQDHNLSSLLKILETHYIQAQNRTKTIDHLLATSRGKRLSYLDQALEKTIGFHTGLCRGGVYAWAQEFPPGTQIAPKTDQTKLQLKTYSDLNNSRLTPEVFKLQLNQLTPEQIKSNPAHYVSLFSTMDFQPEIQSSVDLLPQRIIQAIKTAGFNYYQRSQELPTIEICLRNNSSAHAFGLKVFRFNNQFFYRFLDYNYGEFEFSSLKSFNIFLSGFLKNTPYLSELRFNCCELRFLRPRHPNQNSILHEFKLKIAQSKHPGLKALHQEASLSSRDTQLRADLKTALKFRSLGAGKNIQLELEKGLNSFKQIHEKTLEDKITAYLLYKPLSEYYLPQNPNKWLISVDDHLNLIANMAKDDSAEEWRWRLILARDALGYTTDDHALPILKDDAFVLLKVALKNIMCLQISKPGPVENKVLDYQKQASKILAELAQNNEFPSQLTKILAKTLDNEAVQNYLNAIRSSGSSGKILISVLSANITPIELVKRIASLSIENRIDIAVTEPAPTEKPRSITRLRAKL